MITKRGTIICDLCGKFCCPFDSWVPFGCANPEYPEPYDPSHSCKKCFRKHKQEWIDKFNSGSRYGDYQKSKAERDASKESDLVWIDSSGHGELGTKNFAEPYQYIPKEEYDRLSKFPYWGYCKKCGTENKNAYCSNKNCENSFDSKFPKNDLYPVRDLNESSNL